MSHTKFLVFLFFFIKLTIWPANQEYKFDLITTSSGLPSNIIFDIYQDKMGFIWIASDEGLCRYDGYNFKIFDFYHCLKNKQKTLINKITEDNANNIWLGTSNGLIRYDRKKMIFSHHLLANQDSLKIYRNIIRDLLPAENGTLWLGTANGFINWNYAKNDFKIYLPDSTKNSINGSIINSLTFDQNKNIIIATNSKGICSFEPKSEIFTSFPSKNKPRTNVITTIRLSENKRYLWVAMYNYGLRKWDLKTGECSDFTTENSKLSSNRILKLLLTKENIIWLGTAGKGVIRYNPENSNFLTFRYDSDQENSIVSDFVYPFLEDQTGIIWFGSAMSGINKLDKFNHKFKHLKREKHQENTLSSNRILSLCTDSYGFLWIGTDGQGVNRINLKTNEIKIYTSGLKPGEIHGKYVLDIYEDKKKNLWLGTDGGGLYKYIREKDNFDFFQDGNELFKNQISSISSDFQGSLWLVTKRDGIKKLSHTDKNFTKINIDSNPGILSNKKILDIAKDNEEHLWAISANSILHFDPEKNKFTKHAYQEHLQLKNIFIDSDNEIWCGSKKGLYQYNTNTKEFLLHKNGSIIQDNKINGIISDNNGNLWLGTDKGISRFSKKTSEFKNYTENDGLLEGFINDKAICKDSKGNLYFGGNNGISWFNPLEIMDNSKPPKIYITKIDILKNPEERILQENVIFLDSVILNYNQNTLNLEFSALSFSRPEKNKYFYKLFLDGNEMPRQNLESQRKLNFTNLPPGEIRLELKAANSDNTLTKTGRNFFLIIKPPFWQTWWFRLLLIFSGYSILYSLHKIRIKRIEKRKSQLEERVIERTNAANKLNRALDEVKLLKEKLEAENCYLQNEIKTEHNFADFISKSSKVRKILNRVEQVSFTDTTVLILGETGTGKELIARAIHNLSQRKDRALIKINCAALPANLIESELFGHEKGAFTGAFTTKAGKFELAEKGTIFLDEIGELPLEIQVKLLRILQEKEFEKIGGHVTQKADVRVIAATNRNLEKEIKLGNFREDLFFRLNIFPISIPPLRERKEDIPLLVKHFTEKYSNKIGRKITKIPQAIIEDLQKYNWPGNIRELENTVERAVIISTGEKLIIDNLGTLLKDDKQQNENEITSLEENERNHIIKALKLKNWKVSGENGAAELLKINPQTLSSRIKKLRIIKEKS